MWRIWYDDANSISGSTPQEWDAAPRHGVLYVRQDRLNHSGLDYYWLERDTIKSCNRADIDRYLERPEGLKCVKFGRWGDNYTWERVRKEATKCKEC